MTDPKNWDKYSAEYLPEMSTSYHRERLRMIEKLLEPSDFDNLVDFGCGDGRFLERACTGWGIDISAEMLARAKEQLRNNDAINWRIGSVDALSGIPSDSVSAVLCANVLAYLNEDEESSFYQQAWRILKPSGALVVTHSNELFDMFTLNSFTVRFFVEHFGTDVTSLLRHPDLPNRNVHRVRANPLNFCVHMETRGFLEVQQEYAIHHPEPPLLDPFHDPDDLRQREISSVLAYRQMDRWKAMFTCSVFGSRLLKSEEPVTR